MGSTERQGPAIGVLAMQGAFAEHIQALGECGAEAFEVRAVAELEQADGIVIPGGESTAIRKALDRCGLLEPLRQRIAEGLPAFGTCAGMIVLAQTAPDGAPPSFGLLDVDIERNGFGPQTQSAEREVWLGERTAQAVFIRAPRITRVGSGVDVVARLGSAEGEPVAVAQGHLLGCAYHPELTGDRTLHERFVSGVITRCAS